MHCWMLASTNLQPDNQSQRPSHCHIVLFFYMVWNADLLFCKISFVGVSGVDNVEPLIYLKDSALFKTLKRTGSPRLYEQRLWSLFVWMAGDCLEIQVQLTEIIIKKQKSIRVKFYVMGQCFSIEPAGAREDSGHVDLDGTQCWSIPLETSASGQALLGKVAAVKKMITGAWYRCSPEPVTINYAKCR